ncbi:hypothetical protein HK104_011514 [Borealophlyctis nickersoniae]|nr:hypothetical protein HK104_011514 [Borealophlyctis nickersoniae]
MQSTVTSTALSAAYAEPSGGGGKQSLTVSPADFQFTHTRMNVGYISKITLTNRNPRPVGFKFKTNAPARYSVKPVVGALDVNASVDVFGT